MYVGETSRNLYTRMKEHKSSREEEGFMNKHMREFHKGKEEEFIPRMDNSNKDCLTRQVKEGVKIRRYGQKMQATEYKVIVAPT